MNNTIFDSGKLEKDLSCDMLSSIIREHADKIPLRPISSAKENQLLNRAISNLHIEYAEAEHIVLLSAVLQPSAQAICRLIVQDFIQILQIKNKDDFNPGTIVDFVNELGFADDHLGKAHTRIFKATFAYMLLQIWISHTFTYKNYGIVHQLSNKTRGLKGSKLAALFGIMSIFLNRHSGVVNRKHTEMRKLAAKYFPVGCFGEVMIYGNEETQLIFLLSMMDFLGFKYVGVE